MTYQAAHINQFHDAQGHAWPKSFGKDLNGENCWAATGAEALDFATRGAQKLPPNKFRDESGDRKGGANRGDVERVLKAHGVIANTPNGVRWDQVKAKLATGRWGVWIATDYDAIPDNKSCQPTFDGYHALWLPPIPMDAQGRMPADDPLCDKTKWYPEVVIRVAAEKVAREVGPQGLLVVFVKQVPAPKPVPPPPPTDPKDKAIADLTAQVASLSQIVSDLTDVNADLVAKLDAVKAAIA